jgi:phosphonoacetaldehyde hydrolase
LSFLRAINQTTPLAACGDLQAVVFDWAGTAIDFGSLAPVRALQGLFAGRACPITEEEARQDMGLLKKDHIRAILGLPRVALAWQQKTGHASSEADVESLYAEFIPLQLRTLVNYSGLIPGVREVASRIQRQGLNIGTTTGYTRAMLDLLVEEAAMQGYVPDANLCPEDVAAGRPHPFMILRLAAELGIWPLAAIVKVGDTIADVQEGRNAGTWTVGVAITGNMIGLSEASWNALTPDQQEAPAKAARQALLHAGAHYVVDRVADIVPILDEINARLRRGECP